MATQPRLSRGVLRATLQPVLVFDDLPERVLLDDLVAVEVVDVATLVVEVFSVRPLAAHGPQRNAAVASEDIFVVIPAHIRDLLEAVGERRADCGLTAQRPADRLGT